MNILIYAVYFLWILSEVLLNRLTRSGKSDKQAADKNTELYIWISIIVSVTVGVFVSKAFAMPVFTNHRLVLIGIAIIILGILIRLIAIKQLGKFFTVDITIRKDHQLMQNGFYKFLRHPSYTGSLISFLGFGFSLNNWISIAIVFLPTFFTFIYRISIEEKVLTEQFGKQYTEYKSKTKRLIPFVY
jgi:protein-S-isoprenylcysteine O-methyltransferase Ste14